jgi:uncharacterized Zn-binding protein involved in type VI secretion
MRRYFLKFGDQAANGAVVAEGFDADTHFGVALTFVGAQMACPVCKSTGVIVANGPRMPGLCMGKQQALSGDLCVCKCDKPSSIYQSQTDTYETLTDGELAEMGFAPGGVPLLYYHDEQLTLRDQRTKWPLAGIVYRVSNGSTVIASGKTDGNGRTERIRTDDSRSIVIEIARS